jgi:hypothetical protein
MLLVLEFKSQIFGERDVKINNHNFWLHVLAIIRFIYYQV